MENIPLVIGTGLAGLAISHQLTKKQIKHVLIGKPVTVQRPKLGESVEMLGCTLLVKMFPHLKHHFYPKLGINYHLPKSTCHFDFNRCFKIPEIIDLMEHTKYPVKFRDKYGLIHVDRALFDVELFNEVCESQYCHYLSNNIIDIQYDEVSDSIKSIELDDKTRFSPSYIYDASNTARLLAKASNVENEPLSDKLRVVFTHYKKDESLGKLSGEQYPWLHVTNILRHYPETSGFKGSSWCIPVGDYISIGTNTDAVTSEGLTDEDILNITDKQYKAVNVDYRQVYKDTTHTVSYSGNFHCHRKVYGKNWIMCAGAAAQTWYTAQTGVEASLLIANIADRLLSHPKYYGEYYSKFISRQIDMHKIHDWLHLHDAEEVSDPAAYAYMINSIRNIQSRYLIGLLTLDHKLFNKLAWLSDIKKYMKALSSIELDEIISLVKDGKTCAEYIT